VAHATSVTRAPGACVDLAIRELVCEKDLSLQTLVRIEALMRQFASFLERGFGLHDLSAVTSELVAQFVFAPDANAGGPTASTMHFRRWAVRSLFRILRSEGLDVRDPTLDLVLPGRAGPGEWRPLEDDEVDLCRAACLGVKRGDASVAWALAEATARTGELPHVRRSDVDLDHAVVRLAGTRRVAPRRGHLSPWGSAQLQRVLSDRPGAPDDLLLSYGDPESALAQSSAVGVISRTLRRAGLGDASDVRPSSIPAWAGRIIFEETGQIHLVASRLGFRSLDRAARFIGWEWSERT
jgi:integrase